jgi:hypothetical protein
MLAETKAEASFGCVDVSAGTSPQKAQAILTPTLVKDAKIADKAQERKRGKNSQNN